MSRIMDISMVVTSFAGGTIVLKHTVRFSRTSALFCTFSYTPYFFETCFPLVRTDHVYDSCRVRRDFQHLVPAFLHAVGAGPLWESGMARSSLRREFPARGECFFRRE